MAGQIYEIKTDVAVIKIKQENMLADIESKHQQNRSAIHDLRGTIQGLTDQVTNLRIKGAVYNILSGAAVALMVKGIEVLFMGKK